MRVQGIDAVFIGANDLSASMGLLGEPTHPRVLNAIQDILKAGKKAGVPVGLVASDADDANEKIREGFQFVGIGLDVVFLSTSCRNLCQKIVKE